MNLHPILIFLLICLIQQIIFAADNCNDPNAVSDWCIDLSLCRPNPICTMNYDPVCGCDENTYSNLCMAEANAIRTRLHQGVCIPMMKVVPTKRPTPCDKKDSKKSKNDNDENIDIKCEKILREGQNNKNECINADSCRDRPLRCTREYRPVCGCNGKTYANECVARTAAVSQWWEGAC